MRCFSQRKLNYLLGLKWRIRDRFIIVEKRQSSVTTKPKFCQSVRKPTSIATRPDISSAVGVLSQFMPQPGTEHWAGIKRVFRYIKGTVDFGLKFVASDKGNFSLEGFADADWAGDVSPRKSTPGYVFRLGGATISWKSKRQPIVTLSSTEAEYVALCTAAQEAIWLRHLL